MIWSSIKHRIIEGPELRRKRLFLTSFNGNWRKSASKIIPLVVILDDAAKPKQIPSNSKAINVSKRSYKKIDKIERTLKKKE